MESAQQLIIDAGPVNSSVLFQISKSHGAKPNDASNPVTVKDVSLRVGGATAGSGYEQISRRARMLFQTAVLRLAPRIGNSTSRKSSPERLLG